MFEPIETERLRLRRPVTSDLDALVARRNDPEVAEYQDWTLPWPEDRARIVLAELGEIPEPVDDDWWMLTVETLDDGRIVGDVSLKLEWEGRAAEVAASPCHEPGHRIDDRLMDLGAPGTVEVGRLDPVDGSPQ